MKRFSFMFSFFVVGALGLLLACNSSSKVADGRHNMQGKENLRTHEMMTETYKVSGNCGMCKDRIEEAAKNVKGVTQANWSVSKKILTVMYFPDQTNGLAIQKAVANVGHDTEKYKADIAVYNKLPSCCRYEHEL